MREALRYRLAEMVNTDGAAYVRNMAAAERAIERGPFNLAKVLRATAHTQCVMALNAARLLAEAREPQ